MILRNGTVYGHSPRMRFDLVVNTFVKDALVQGRLLLHGGGWMWRPLVDVRDVSDAMVAAYEAPEHIVKGEIYNVLHSNYQIRELAMLVAGSAQLWARPSASRRRPRRSSRATTSARTRSFPPRSGSSRAARWWRRCPTCSAAIDIEDRSQLTDPRYYNIRWLQLLHEVQPRIEEFGSVL